MDRPPWPAGYEAILREYCRLLPADEELEADRFMRDLGVDSVSMLGLIVRIEETWEIELPLHLLNPQVLATPATLWAAIEEIVADPTGSCSGAPSRAVDG
jgi:acyl carrier protein